jgi:outer membrane protein OmpA-like peptidoglycan-associated protein
MKRSIRFAMLAGAIAPLALSAPAGYAETVPVLRSVPGTIVIAQAQPNPNDPKAKGQPQPKGPPPKGPQAGQGQGSQGGQQQGGQQQGTQQGGTQQQLRSFNPGGGTTPSGQRQFNPQNTQQQPQQGMKVVPGTLQPSGQTQQVNPATQQKLDGQMGPKGPAPQNRQVITPTTAPTNNQFQQQRQFSDPKTQHGPTGVVTLQQGHVDQLRSGRIERKDAAGRVIITEPGGRLIIREQGRAFIRHDDTLRFQAWGGPPRIERRGAEQFAYIGRPGGYQIITVTGPDGRVLRRIRRGPDGTDVILFTAGAAAATGFILALAAPRVLIPRDHYIVDVAAAPPALLYETLDAEPVDVLERPYTLDEIRFNVALRDRVRRLDLDSVTFDTGSWQIMPEQYPKLEVIAEAMRRVLARNPNSIFMIEGHTDRVGNSVDNLSLSDRRAESVAVVLTEQFQIPPENLVTQGYGEQFPKVDTDGPSRENRRVSIRNVTRLLAGS